VIDKLPTCTASIDENRKKKSAKISKTGMVECLRFLTLCGFEIPFSVDIQRKPC